MKNVFLIFSFVAVLFISACGSNSSSPDTPLATNVTSAPTPTAPSAPAGATITAGDGKVMLSWTAVADATSYNAYYGTTAGVTIANGTKVTGATSGSAITGLVNGTPYFFVVTAVNTAGESGVSSEVSATPVATAPAAPAPSAPTGVSLKNGNAQVILTWPNVTGATSYNVYYSSTPGVSIANGTKITNTTSGTPITGLTNGTAYYFVLTALQAGSESAISSELGTAPQAPAAGVPSGVTIIGGNGQVLLSWTAVTGATSYNVYYGTTAGVTTANGTKVTGVTSGGAITGLTNGTKYYFIVTAMSNSNTIENTASAWISAIPQAIPNLLGGAIQKELTLTGAVTTIITKAADGSATTSYKAGSSAITTDGTNLYIAVITYYGYTWDSGAVFKKVEIATGITSTVYSGTSGSGVGDWMTTDGNNLFTTGFMSLGPYAGNPNHSLINKTAIATGTSVLVAGSSDGFADGTGSAAQFKALSAITMDGTNLYVADSGNNTIRKIVIATGAVTTIAGMPGLSGTANATGAAARFNNPQGITTDGTNLYVVDTGNNLIRKVVIATGEVTTLAGGYTGLTYDGTGTGAQFKAPYGITSDGKNLYVADSGAHTIRKVVIASGVVTTIAGSADVAGNTNGTGTAALFNTPKGITTDGASLYVTDATATIRKIQ